ncbi:hypothetical protein QQP08_012513 [Theobroma cacao]|nr:hypothetical protein QQP08_012513 [Theobroma cacao]
MEMTITKPKDRFERASSGQFQGNADPSSSSIALKASTTFSSALVLSDKGEPWTFPGPTRPRWYTVSQVGEEARENEPKFNLESNLEMSPTASLSNGSKPTVRPET